MVNSPSTDSAKTPLRCTAAIRWLDMPNNIRLRAGRWEPVKMPKATVIILQGRGEFVEKYEEVAEELTSRGIRVLTLDWRGQGRSTRLLRNPQRGHIHHYDDYVADLHYLWDRMGRFAAEGKIFWLAHSMGALIALLALAKRPQQKLDGLIFLAPMIDILTGPANPKAVQALAEFACKSDFADTYAFQQQDYSPIPFEGNPLTTDRAQFERLQQWYQQEPALQLGCATFGWLNATFQASTSVKKLYLPDVVKVPSLILGTPSDRVVSYSSQQWLADQLPKCTLKTYTGSGHELFMESESVRKQVWKDIDDFMKIHVPNYVGGGKDRVKPKTGLGFHPPKPPSWRPGSR